jgi:hypothetical protein
MLCAPAKVAVFMLGQATGLVIYSRNIYFIWLGKRVPAPAKLV